MLHGALAARDCGSSVASDHVAHFVCDEETGSDPRLGTSARGEIDLPNALAMLAAEPTGGVVWHACRGGITLRVGVRGREAHVGQAHLGSERVRAR